MTRLSRGVAAGLTALAVAGGVGCTQGGEASRVRERIAQGAERAEARDVPGLLALAAGEFRAQPGDRNRDATAEALGAAFYSYRSFRLLYPRPTVELARDGSRATAALPLLVVRRERTYPGLDKLAHDPAGWLARVGDNADLYHLELALVKRHGEWLATAAHLRGAGMFSP